MKRLTVLAMLRGCLVMGTTGAIVACVLCVGLLLSAPRAARADEWALLIGIDQYEDSNHINNLGGASADARALQKTLHSSAGFPEEHIKILVSDGEHKPTRSNILDELEKLSQNAKAGDTVFVLYSGHGMDIDGVSYLLPYDTKARSDRTITDTAIKTQEFHDYLRQVKARAMIMAFDMCRSDPRKSGKSAIAADNKLTHSEVRGLDLSALGSGAKTTKPVAGGSGTIMPIAVTLYSCAEGERSYEWLDKKRGYFSYYLEAGLNGAAVDKAGHVTVGSLADYVENHVKTKVHDEEHSAQTPYPSLDGPDARDFVLARSGKSIDRHVVETPVPDEVPVVPNVPNPISVALHELVIPLDVQAATVNAAVFSPDGKYIATGSYENNARTWDAATGNRVLQLSHTAQVNAVAYSRDGRFLLTGSDDKTAILWNTDTGQQIAVLKAHTSGVNAVAFSPDGRFLATGSSDRTAKIWNAETHLPLFTLGHANDVKSVAFSPDGKRIVTASSDTTAKIWDVETGKLIRKLSGHAEGVNAAAFSPDGKSIVTGSADATAVVWETETGLQRKVLSGHAGAIMSVAFSPNGKYVVTGSMDGTAKVWDASSGQMIQNIPSSTGAIYSASFSPDGRFLLAGSADHSVKVWAFPPGQTGSE